MASITIINGENTVFAPLSEKHKKFFDFEVPNFLDSVTCVICTLNMLRYEITKTKGGSMYVIAYCTFTGNASDDLDFIIE